MHLQWPKLTANKGVALRQDGGGGGKRLGGSPVEEYLRKMMVEAIHLLPRNVICLSNSNNPGVY